MNRENDQYPQVSPRWFLTAIVSLPYKNIFKINDIMFKKREIMATIKYDLTSLIWTNIGTTGQLIQNVTDSGNSPFDIIYAYSISDPGNSEAYHVLNHTNSIGVPAPPAGESIFVKSKNRPMVIVASSI